MNARMAARIGWTASGLAIAAAGIGWLLLAFSDSTADRAHGGESLQFLTFPMVTPLSHSGCAHFLGGGSNDGAGR